jgi:thiosulfate/3-mercaptopyruvate sulfurtransferase
VIKGNNIYRYAVSKKTEYHEDKNMNMKQILITAVIMTALLLASFAAAVQLPGPLVETEWLSNNFNTKDLVILDVRQKKDMGVYGFIPNARLWEWSTVRVNRVINDVALEGMVPTKEQFEKLMSDLGVNNNSAVIIVSTFDNTPNMTMATRAYWTLKYFGHDKVSILDGGMAKWASEKRDKTDKPAEVKEKGDFKVTKERAELSASTKDVLKAIEDKKTFLLDGRTPDYYFGENKKDYVSAKGHIPGAKYLPHTELMDPNTKTFKSITVLKELLAKYGVDAKKPAITYCDSGHLSTGLWFVMYELMGNKNVKQFDGSMHEWTKDPKRPVTTEKE